MARRPAYEPFSRDAVFRQVGPVVGIALLGLLYGLRPQTGSSATVVQAAVITAVAVSATLMMPWHRLPEPLKLVPPLVYLLVVFLTGVADGAVGSATSQLVLLPVLWLATYGTPVEAGIGVAGVAVTLALPILLGMAGAGGWGHAWLLVAASAALAAIVQPFFRHLRAHTARLHVLARTDDLTGVANRRGWEEDLSAVLAGEVRRPGPLCVTVLDLDHFKEYNDRFGHQAGDRLLKEVAAAWSGQLRAGDLLARLGGDEFAVLLQDCPLSAAEGIIRRLCQTLPGDVTCSAGVAAWDERESAERLVSRADAALYQAKNGGRNEVVPASA